MSSVGQALGGIVGGVIGFFTGGPAWALRGAQLGIMAGGLIDPPKGPEINGPRLDDLSVQTSTYGAVIPRGYGTFPIVGNVFWLKGDSLTEVKTTTTSGGKGGPQQTTNTWSYYATFAVGLCEGPIDGIRRIWIGGQLWYDAGSEDMFEILASNQNSDRFTLYLGTDTQTADPLMQADKGMANVPAYRGLAYLVFDTLPLAEYGNSLMGAQIKVEVIKSGTWNQGSTVFGILTGSGPRIPEAGSSAAIEYPSSSYPYGSVTKAYNGDISGRRWDLVGWERAEPNFISGRLELEEYQKTYSFSHSLLRTEAAADLEVSGDFTLWCTHNGRGYTIYSSSSPAYLIACGTSNAFAGVGNWSLDWYLDNFQFNVRNSGSVIATVSATLASYDDSADYTIKITRTAGVLRIYINGVLEGTQVGTDNTTLSVGAPIAIGGTYDGHYLPNDYGSGSYHNVVMVRGSPATWATVMLADIVEAECLTTNLLTAGDIDVTELTDMVRGYRVGQIGAIRGGLDPLRAAWPFDVVQHGYQIKFKRRGSASVATIDAGLLDARSVSDQPGVQITDVREMDLVLPREVTLKYLDASREYDINQQIAARINTDAVNQRTVDLPIVFNADEAKQTADMLLYLYWLERYDISFVLPHTYANLEPADVVTLVSDDATYTLRLTGTNTLPDGRIETRAKYHSSAIYSQTSSGEEGQSTGAALLVGGGSLMVPLDIPLMRDADDAAGFPVAMCGYMAGWPGGLLYRSDDGGQTWQDLTAFAAPGCVIGYATGTLAAHGGTLLDKASTLTVKLYSGSLASVTEAQMFAGQNWFAYGTHGRWEIIAAQNCVLQGDGSYVLSDFMRGQHGTEWATGLHAANDYLVELDTSALDFINVNSGSIGTARIYRAVTNGKPLSSATDESFTYAGVNLECVSPVNLTGNRDPGTNDWTLAWTRRSRYAQWRDLVDAPLGETGESYEVDIYSDGTYATLKRTLTASTPTVSYTSAQQVTDFGSNQATLYVKVYQLSATVGRGYALTTSITR